MLNRTIYLGIMISAASPNIQAQAATYCTIPSIGQSNDAGFGDPAQSVKPPTGVSYYDNPNGTDVLANAIDPICSTCGGSIHPAFGAEFHNQTGMNVLFVVYAQSGGILSSSLAASQNPPVTNHWGATGTAVASAFAKIDRAIAVMTAANVPIKTDCGVIFIQGESEAQAIAQGGATSKADWKNEFKGLVLKWRAKYGSSTPFYIVKIGTVQGNIAWQEGQGYSAMRDAEEEVAQEIPRVIIVSRKSLECAANYALLPPPNGIHWPQVCNNDIGRDAGANAARSGLWK